MQFSEGDVGMTDNADELRMSSHRYTRYTRLGRDWPRHRRMLVRWLS